MSWIRHVACKEEDRSAYMVLVGKSEGKRYLKDVDIDERIVL
jgi:hypothetical protein